MQLNSGIFVVEALVRFWSTLAAEVLEEGSRIYLPQVLKCRHWKALKIYLFIIVQLPTFCITRAPVIQSGCQVWGCWEVLLHLRWSLSATLPSSLESNQFRILNFHTGSTWPIKVSLVYPYSLNMVDFSLLSLLHKKWTEI